jgi:ABC-2 type transport system ATP-binding protein
MLAVEAHHGLTKVFGSIRALDGLSFNVKPGEVFGLIGPNGAGENDRVANSFNFDLCQLLAQLRFLGMMLIQEAAEVRQIISYLPEEAGAYRYLSGLEYLGVYGKVSHE